jgi:hypothetical protein
LSDHQFPPVWAPDLGSGHGQPLFEFAPPLVYAAALPFFKAGMSLADSLQFGLAILFALGAIAVFLIGRKLSFSRAASIGAAAAWLFAPYQALDIYVCARFAESAAIAVAPVALLGLIVAVQCPTAMSVALGALAVAMLPLAHNAIALLMFPAFAAIVAVRSIVSDHRLKTAAAGACVLVGGLALSAFFWLPALLERDFVKTDLLRTGFLNWTNYIISPFQLFWSPWGFVYAVRGPMNGISYSLGPVHIALAVAGVLIAIRAANRTRRLDFGAREYSARAKDAGDLCQQAILQRWGLHVMEHREAHSSIEARIFKRHGAGVLAEHRHVAAGHPARKRIRERAVDLHAG